MDLDGSNCCALSNETTVELVDSDPTWITVMGFEEKDAEELAEGGRWKGRGKGRGVASIDSMVEYSSEVCPARDSVSFRATTVVGEKSNQCLFCGQQIMLWARQGKEKSMKLGSQANHRQPTTLGRGSSKARRKGGGRQQTDCHCRGCCVVTVEKTSRSRLGGLVGRDEDCFGGVEGGRGSGKKVVVRVKIQRVRLGLLR